MKKIFLNFQIKKDFIQLLRDHPAIDRHSRWSDIKKKIDSESRYRAVENSILREDYFHEYIKILKEEKKKSKENREKKEKKKDKDKDREREKERRSRDEDEDKKDIDKVKKKKSSYHKII